MKKLITILLLLVLNISLAKAAEYKNTSEFGNNVNDFNYWLYDNGHNQYVKAKENKICDSLEKEKQAWYDNGCNKVILSNNLKIKFYKNRWQIPWDSNPNRDTLIYYLWKTINHPYSFAFHTYEIKPSSNSYEFKSNLRKNEYLNEKIKKSGILSYLLFENDEIIIDEKSPDLGKFFDKKTKLRSNSMGKSMVGYLAGHAICAGYIDSLDTKLNDWPLIQKTLYHDQKLIDLLNMSAGDQKFVTDQAMFNGISNDDENLVVYMQLMEGSKKAKTIYNYHALYTNIIFNYIKHKTGDEFEKFLEDVFQKHVKIKNSVIFFKHRKNPDAGKANAMFYADRYDYLRIAKTMMDDYQSNNCVGKYLKEIYARKVVKGGGFNGDRAPIYGRTPTYGGQFHFDYPGLKDRPIFGMSGYAGNVILIDPETSKIVVLHSIHHKDKKGHKYYYDFKKIVLEVFK
ncbi:hypothetical protein N9341_04875 [Candidatus Pelagibacter sp.]|nr:hypothetical protein [Candidatus Pelagibacter sp.]